MYWLKSRDHVKNCEKDHQKIRFFLGIELSENDGNVSFFSPKE